MQCHYLLNNKTRCKLKTGDPCGYCHVHKNKRPVAFRFPKPKMCPVCWCSLHQCQRPLECEHWVHRKCVERSGKAECPICRKELTNINCKQNNCNNEHNLTDTIYDILEDPDTDRIEIPEDAVTLAVITYQLYAFVISPRNRVLGLDHFISCAVNDIIALDHPAHSNIASFLYAEALGLFFDPQIWNNAVTVT